MTRKIASVTNRKAIHISRLFWSAKAILLNAPIADNKVGITIGINNRGNTSSLYFVFTDIVANNVPIKLIPRVARIVTKMV